MELRTERLVLRRWTAADRPAFREMNADPVVMATIGPVMTADQADAMLDRIEANTERHGFGLWCVTVAGEPVGWTGLSVPAFRPQDVEIGWRLRSGFWGHGYATEAARAVVDDAFGRLGLTELISFTVATNHRSQAVMQRIGMTRDPAGDFDHPSVPADSPLCRHVLYRLASGHVTQASG